MPEFVAEVEQETVLDGLAAADTGAEPAAAAETLVVDDTFWIEAVQKLDNGFTMMVIMLGMIIGLLCAVIVKRG